MFLKATRGRVVCTEISGLTPSMMKKNGQIQEIKLSNDNKSLIGTGFTSQYVKDIIKDQVFKRTKKFQSISESMCRLVDNGLITPIMFSNNDEYMHIIENFNVYQYEKRIMGFYDTQENSIFLCLNNLAIGSAGSISDSSIVSLIAHELMHYACKNHFKEYKSIWDQSTMAFYKVLFKGYFCLDNIPNELIRNYVDAMYKMERNGNTKDMFIRLDDILKYAEDHTNDENTCYANYKALDRLFQYMCSEPDNKTGVKIGKLSRAFFAEHFQNAYNKIFFALNPKLASFYDFNKGANQEDSNRIDVISTFYQEFIASSEISAMIAGTLIKELYTQQKELDKDNPVAKLINNII